MLAFLALGGLTGGTAQAQGTTSDEVSATGTTVSDSVQPHGRRPQEKTAVRSGRSFRGDLRMLPYIRPVKKERPEREPPPFVARVYRPPGGNSVTTTIAAPTGAAGTTAEAPAPAPSSTFNGLDFANWGAGHPPDTTGDVGPTYYIQTVNTSVGIYDKASGVRVAAFTFDTLMSQGQFGNLCDTDNFGDPVVLYDSFEDRWIITDFAFKLDGSGNVINPPGAFQCFAVSKTGDPVAGGWNFYSINTTGGLGDYPKFGVWTDGIYMSANMFDYAASGSFQNARVYAFNKAQMYAGAPTVQVVSFDADPSDFTLLPSNARLQTGTPPAGRPNLFISTWEFLNALTVYKFHVDWNHISLSTFTGPDVPATGSSWPNQSVPNAATPGNSLDTLEIRAMVQNQYSNIGGVESLWTTHTVRRATNGFATPRWYQVNVTGGTVAANTLQTATWDPDGADITYRYTPSLAIDRSGDMALGYTASNSTTNPGLKYAGRLSSDAPNTFSQTEQTLWQGTGTQTGNCGSSTCTRWGDYSAMTIDPDGCRFWYTNEYYAVNGLNDMTRIGAFKYSQCTPFGNGGTVAGQVTVAGSGTPIVGASVALGSRTTTTDGGGNYSFSNIPAGTYLTISASNPGYDSATQSPVVVTDSVTTTKNFSLTAAPATGCLTDTTQADFQSGVPNGTDLSSSPGDVRLTASTMIDQQSTTASSMGNGISTTMWEAQTFIPSVSGQVTRVDGNLFCSSCSGANPAVTIEVRSTNGGIPDGAILATTTIPGFSSGTGVFYSANFSSPATLDAGTGYAIVARLAIDRTSGTYAWLRSNNNQYANGAQFISTNSGSSWSVQATDLGFKVYMIGGFTASGDFVSSVKDANPAAGLTPQWATLSWTASVPVGSTLRFQAAASNDANGVFNFVGPDGTANTFFSNGGSLTQFNGSRYLKYKALFATSNNSASPTLNAATVCFDSSQGLVTPTPTPTPTPTATPAPTATPTPTPTPIPKQDQTINFPVISTKTYGSADFDPGATASSSLAVTYGASGGCSIVSSKIHITAAGSCTVTASQNGDSQYNAATSVSRTFSILSAATTTTSSLLSNTPNPAPQFSDTARMSATVTPSSTATGNGMFAGTVSFIFNGSTVGGPVSVSNSSPTAQVSFKLDQTRIPAGAGSYNISATFTPSAGSNYAGSTSGVHAAVVKHEGEKTDNTGDASTRVDYAGSQYVLLGSAPTLTVYVKQSLAPDVEAEFIDFSKVNVYVVFKIVPAACGTSCSDTPVWQSANIKVANRSDWSKTAIGTAHTTTPATLSERSYLVLVNLVANGYIIAERAAASLDVASNTGRFISGGGLVSTDSTSSAGTRSGYFGFNVKGTTTLAGSSLYLYRTRMDVTTSTATNIVACATLGGGCTDVDIIIRSNSLNTLNTGTTSIYPLTGYAIGHAAVQFANAYSGVHYTQFEFANGLFRLDALDNSSGGSTDKYGFTAYRSNSSIFHQALIGGTAQTGTAAPTNKITIGGGNTAVHPK